MPELFWGDVSQEGLPVPCPLNPIPQWHGRRAVPHEMCAALDAAALR